MKKKSTLFTIVGCLFGFSVVCAQTTEPASADTNGINLEQLLNLNFSDEQVRGTVKQQNIGVATASVQKEEEVPSIVSVISRKEILQYGFRDLSDILRSIPGFEFGVDGTNLFGWGFRGIWVYEGKGSLLINNLPVNDYAYGNVNFIGSFPAAMIEKVEVVRGPGSVLYGGFSEVTVVNVITRNERDAQYVRFNSTGFSLNGKEFGGSGNLAFGGRLNDLRFNTSVGYGLHPTASRTYSDFWGDSLAYGLKNSSRQWYHLISDLNYKNFDFRYHHVDFKFTGQDGYTTIIPTTERGKNTELLTNYSDAVYLRYNRQVSKLLRLEPVAEYSRGNPINGAASPNSVVTGQFSGIGAITHHLSGNLTAHLNFEKYGTLSVGGGYTRDIILNTSREGEPGLYGKDTNPANYTFSRHTESKVGFAQYTLKLSPLFSTVIGNRFENNTFGDAWAPRLGLVFQKEKLNAKLLYSQAYRIPMPWQAYSRWITFNDQIRPETSENYELELGYKVSDNISAKANGYFIDIKDPIIWNGSNLQYGNTGRIQSMGVEGNVLFNFNTWGGYYNFAYSKPGSASSGDYLTADKKQTIGLPPLKMNLGFTYRFKKVQVSPSLVYLSERYGQTEAFARKQLEQPATRDFESQRYPQVLLTNCNILYRKVLPGMSINFSVYNIFDAKYILIQPYYAGHAPVPVNERQYTLGVTYEFSR